MREERKVVVITGASQGIGAGLVKGFLDRGYCVVANSRTIEPRTSPDLLTVAGDIADPETASRIVGAAIEQLRPRRYAGEQCRRFPVEAIRRIFRIRPCNGDRHKSRRLLPPCAKSGGSDASGRQRSYRQCNDEPGRPTDDGGALGARGSDQGRPRRRHPVAGDRIRRQGYPRERGVPRHHQDPHALARSARLPRDAPPRGPHGRRSRKSSRPCSTSRQRASSRVRRCTSTAALTPVDGRRRP